MHLNYVVGQEFGAQINAHVKRLYPYGTASYFSVSCSLGMQDFYPYHYPITYGHLEFLLLLYHCLSQNVSILKLIPPETTPKLWLLEQELKPDLPQPGWKPQSADTDSWCCSPLFAPQLGSSWLCRGTSAFAEVLALLTTAQTTPRCQPPIPELQLNPLKVRKELLWKSQNLQDRTCRCHSPSHTNIHPYLLPVKSNNKNWSELQKFCCTYRVADGKWRKVPPWTYCDNMKKELDLQGE